MGGMETESGLEFDSAGGQGTIGASVHDGPLEATVILMWTESESGTWFGIRGHSSGATAPCSGSHARVTGANKCDDAEWD